jgi:hypothetical protein
MRTVARRSRCASSIEADQKGEFGITGPAWTAIAPDRGTAAVVWDGARILWTGTAY